MTPPSGFASPPDGAPHSFQQTDRAAIAFYMRILMGEWPSDFMTGATPPLLDWPRLERYCCGCGFAGALTQPEILVELSAFTPPSFIANLRRRATADALRELSHADALARIHAALQAQGTCAVLLKGAALYLLEKSHGLLPQRIPGDIDLWIESPAEAAQLRQRLLDLGFSGDPAAPRTAPHHLAAVAWRNSAVEIHTAPMPAFWGMPDSDLASRAIPVPGWPCYFTLCPTDMILHESVHCTSHLWSFGLKLAWDFGRIQRLAVQTGTPDRATSAVTWNQLPTLAESTRSPLGFWAPILALQERLPPKIQPFPVTLTHSAPSPCSTRRATALAQSRMFSATEDAAALNPFTRNAIFLSLFQGQRMHYVRELLTGSAAEARRSALASSGQQSWKHLPAHLFRACKDLLRPPR